MAHEAGRPSPYGSTAKQSLPLRWSRAEAEDFDRIGADRLVFVTKNGLSPGRRNVLRAIQAQAGKLGLEGVGAHSLRHSAAGLLRSAGLGDEAIAATLRHASVRVTQAVYGGMSPDDLT